MYDSVRPPARAAGPEAFRSISIPDPGEEDQTTVATKRGKSSASRKRATRPTTPKAAAKAPARPAAGRSAAPAKPTAVTKPAAKPDAAKPKAAMPAPPKPPAARPDGARGTGASRPGPAAAVPAPSGPSLLERAEQLRDAVQRSKLTHPDPWTFATKARGWSQRAQALVQEIAAGGDTPATRRSVETLAAEVEGDRDFQEARRLF
jgi:hypothetical protein